MNCDPLPLLRRGTESQLRGELDQAETCYRQILESDPHHATALNNLGYLLGQRRPGLGGLR